LAYQQDGLITRRQALAAGASPDAIRHAQTSGKWQVVVARVYATFAGPVGRIHRLRAAVLHSGPESMITGATACTMMGLRYVPATASVDTLVAADRRPGSSGHVRVTRTSRLPTPVWWIDDKSPDAAADLERALPWWVPGDELAPAARRWTLPMAPPARAVIDAVRFRILHDSHDGQPWRSHQLLRDTRALLCEVVQRRQCSVADLVAELEAAPRAGTATIRTALDDVRAGCRSAPECDLRDLIRSCQALPEPRWNQPLPDDPTLIPDACWPEAKLVVEVDSVEWHQFGEAPDATARRHARYAALGWRVFPMSPYRLRNDAANVRRELLAAYRSGLA
jgi:hypothetical protein